MWRHQISVVEFLKSGRLSNSVCLLQDEDDGAFATQTAEDDGNWQQRRIMENAARLALLVSRSLVRLSANDGDSTIFSSIELRDLFVDFEQHEMDGGEDHSNSCTFNNGPPPEIVLLGMDNLSPTTVHFFHDQKEEKAHSEAIPLHNLGKLFLSIFFQGGSPPPGLIDGGVTPSVSGVSESSTCANRPDDDYSECIRSFQRPKITTKTVFSELVDTKAFPISICRFLSDTIDSGPGGKAESPFTSIQEVAQELEHLISRPEIFLHDSYFPHEGPQMPVFGRAHRGRGEKVRVLMELADQMEQSLSFEDGSRGCSSFSLDTVFVSGMAGSGKSHLVQAVGEALLNSGWIVTMAKFERGKAYASGGIVSSMFDKLISHFLEMREGGEPADVECCERLSETILNSIGQENLSWLVGFLPTLPLLFASTGSGEDVDSPLGCRLVFCLSKILDAILESGRFVMIIVDDLQWADEASILLICDVLLNVGVQHTSRRCLFVGSFRHDEVDDDHPFSIQYSRLRYSRFINTNEIRLSNLSRNDIVDIVMSELKLPRRIVVELADAVYKKTSGHALYVIEFLNSLLNESILVYSLQKHSFTWDPDRIDFMKTSDNVAELIASKLQSLSTRSLLVLQILSCFGIQTDVSLLETLENFQEGMISSLTEFIDRGILDKAGPIVIFSHDLILQSVYEGMSLAKRKSLHLEIGLHLGAIADAHAPSSLRVMGGKKPLQQSNEKIFFAGRQVTSSLLSLACDQINFAGDDSISDKDQKVMFAKWNLSVGHQMVQESIFSSALHYFSKGISFVGNDIWFRDLQLYSQLHQGVVAAAFALGQYDNVVQHADALMDRVSVNEILEVQVIVLKSLCMAGRIDEGRSRGFKILSQLHIDIPDSPTNEMAVNAMSNTYKTVTKYSIYEIVNLCGKFRNKSVHNVVRVFGAFHDLLWQTRLSLMLLTCECIKYSLKNGVCRESATAFAVYGMLKISNEEDYEGGKKCADISRAIIKKYQKPNKAMGHAPAIHAMMLLVRAGDISLWIFFDSTHTLPFQYGLIDIWFTPLRKIGAKFLHLSNEARKIGLVDDAISGLMAGWSFTLYGGENLSIISQSSFSSFQEIAKYSQYSAMYVICDYILLMELTGKSEDYFSALEGPISSLDDLEAEAEPFIMYHIQVFKLMRSYWKGDYAAAEKNHSIALLNPFTKQDPVHFIQHCFFGGLVSFHLYRTLGGEGRLNEGRKMLVQMEKWATNSAAAFGNKWLLLKAEYAASTNEESNVVEQYFEYAIKAAHDEGNIHELAMAYELFGNYCSSERSGEDHKGFFTRAFVYYKQWGATTVAKKIFREHGLEISSVTNIELQIGNSKHSLPLCNASSAGLKGA